jgi:regulator of RNase E activity RraA
MVLEDVDHSPGAGAMFGEIHAQIAKALGCVAYVTNGAVRDLPALQKLDFPCFSQGACVSHSYAHIIEFGDPVEIGGLKISEGDLLQADLHGVHSVPAEIAGQLGREIDRVIAREAELIAFCVSSNRASDHTSDPQRAAFLDKLKLKLGQGSQECQPPTRFST